MGSKAIKTVVLISAERAELTLRENFYRSIELHDILTELGFKFESASGIYQGTTETSYLIEVPLYSQVSKLLEIAGQFNQECILEIAQGRFGYLLYPNGTEQFIGQVHWLAKDVACDRTQLKDGRSFRICANDEGVWHAIA